VKIDSIVADECKSLIEDFTLSHTLYLKFADIWQTLGIKNKTIKIQPSVTPINSENSAIKLREMAWLLFITAKRKF
jgi:5,10-methylenetetrahydrofolate reductase